MDFNGRSPLCFRHKEIGPPRKGRPYLYTVFPDWCRMKSYAVLGFNSVMHLMKLTIAFDAVSSAANADSIRLANLIFPMVFPPSHLLLPLVWLALITLYIEYSIIFYGFTVNNKGDYIAPLCYLCIMAYSPLK